MAQEYIIRDIKKGSVTKDSYTTYQNYALAVDGIGEPVKLTLNESSTAPEAGDVIYGSLAELDINGKTYYKLQPETKPALDPPTKDELIRSQWAIGQAVQCYLAGEPSPEAYDNIEHEAKHFYQMALRIKGE